MVCDAILDIMPKDIAEAAVRNAVWTVQDNGTTHFERER